VAAFNLAAAKPQMPMSDVVQRVTTRWENHMASDKAQLSDKLGGQTPVAAGQMLYNRGEGGRPPGGQLRRDGLPCNVLSQGQVRLSETEIWLITARDANRRSAYCKTFGGASIRFELTGCRHVVGKGYRGRYRVACQALDADFGSPGSG
jgi:hypothetical protein